MKYRVLNISIFTLGIICLLISLKLFWNIAVYADEYSTSPNIVFGGDVWVMMNWIKFGALSLICIISGINIFKKCN